MVKKNKKTSSLQKKVKIEKEDNSHEDYINWEALLVLLVIFVIVEFLGLFVAYSLATQGVQPEIFAEDSNSIWNAAYLFVSIMIMTAIILLLMRLRKRKQTLWALEALAVFVTSMIVFEIFFGETIGLFLSICVLLWRFTFRKSVLFRNFVGMIAIAGAGGLIGLSLGIVPIVAFITALAIYDLIAVFGTKHMVAIGKEVTKENFAFTIALPTREHQFELGNGDLVIPLVVASSTLVNGPFNNNFIVAGFVLAASYVGLAISIQSVSVLKQPLPALPPQVVLMLIILGISFMLGI